MSEKSNTFIGSTTQGFGEEEIQSFLRQGNSQSVDSLANNRITEPTKKRKFFDKNGNFQERVGDDNSFLGAFSDITDDQLSLISDAFEIRRQNIGVRKARPGRSQLSLQGV